MRAEKEIREASKRLKDEHLRRMRQPAGYSTSGMVGLEEGVDWLEKHGGSLADTQNHVVLIIPRKRWQAFKEVRRSLGGETEG